MSGPCISWCSIRIADHMPSEASRIGTSRHVCLKNAGSQSLWFRLDFCLSRMQHYDTWCVSLKAVLAPEKTAASGLHCSALGVSVSSNESHDASPVCVSMTLPSHLCPPPLPFPVSSRSGSCSGNAFRGGRAIRETGDKVRGQARSLGLARCLPACLPACARQCPLAAFVFCYCCSYPRQPSVEKEDKDKELG